MPPFTRLYLDNARCFGNFCNSKPALCWRGKTNGPVQWPSKPLEPPTKLTQKRTPMLQIRVEPTLLQARLKTQPSPPSPQAPSADPTGLGPCATVQGLPLRTPLGSLQPPPAQGYSGIILLMVARFQKSRLRRIHGKEAITFPHHMDK